MVVGIERFVITKCDNCALQAGWLIYAAYDAKTLTKDAHPTVSRYPLPMKRTCDNHLIDFITEDSESPTSTRQWIVKAVRRA